ncbi:acyl-CoA thioesterase [Enemella sp. A6]|uniref:acyl-CoA thioesterase n=1 Tax=Enemella sp. A6 TaxID=3440152 RepID=UPI003EBBF352
MPRFECDIPKRWGDLDAQVHVNNARFVDYLQEARVDYLEHSENNHMLGNGVLVVRTELEFLRPIDFSEEPVRALVSVETLGGAKFSLGYELWDDGELCARARTYLAPFDINTGRVRRLTDAEREVFRRDLDPVVELRDVPRPRWGDEGHHSPIRVRWSDLDAYGHVNNAMFYDYIQEARMRTLKSVNRGAFAEKGQRLWMVVRQDIDYITQLPFRHQPYDCVTVVPKLGNSSMTLAAELRDENGTVYAAARTVLVCTDLSGRPVPLPEVVRNGLDPYRVETDD